MTASTIPSRSINDVLPRTPPIIAANDTVFEIIIMANAIDATLI